MKTVVGLVCCGATHHVDAMAAARPRLVREEPVTRASMTCATVREEPRAVTRNAPADVRTRSHGTSVYIALTQLKYRTDDDNINKNLRRAIKQPQTESLSCYGIAVQVNNEQTGKF